MKFVVDQGYLEKVEKVTRKAKAYTNVFACQLHSQIRFDQQDDQMNMGYASTWETDQTQYSISDIKRCEVYADGCLLLFKDKKFIFLPLTDSEDNDIELIDFCEYLECKLDGLHFFVMERLNFLVDEKENKRVRVGFSLGDSPIAVIVIAALAAVMATVFVTTRNDYALVKRSECTVYAGTLETYDQDGRGYIKLCFADEELFWIHQVCVSQEVSDKLDVVKAGDQIKLLVNPNVDYVVEMTANGREILNFDISQEAMQNDAVAFMWLGIFIYCCAAFLLVYGAYQFIKEKREK